MKDWKSIAQAMGVEVADEGTLKPLNGLETAFRPLAAQLTSVDDITLEYSAGTVEFSE